MHEPKKTSPFMVLTPFDTVSSFPLIYNNDTLHSEELCHRHHCSQLSMIKSKQEITNPSKSHLQFSYVIYVCVLPTTAILPQKYTVYMPLVFFMVHYSM